MTDADKARLEKRIKAINPMAQIKHAQRGDVSLNYVMDIGGHDLDRVEIEVRVWFHCTGYCARLKADVVFQ